MNTIRRSAVIATTAFWIIGAASALAEAPTVGEVLGTDAAGVSAALTAAGYQVVALEIEDDEIEVLARRDGATYEIEVRSSDGVVVEVGLEDGLETDEDD